MSIVQPSAHRLYVNVGTLPLWEFRMCLHCGVVILTFHYPLGPHPTLSTFFFPASFPVAAPLEKCHSLLKATINSH